MANASPLFWQPSASRKNEQFCVRADAVAGFEQRLFDARWLQREGLLTGRPAGGRGDAQFLHHAGTALVLRHYRRGGMVRHISRDRYVWLGRERTRVAREVSALLYLERVGVPVGLAYAGRIQRCGMSYRCSLLTRRAPGNTLASHLQHDPASLTLAQWQAMGTCIACMHRAGVWHADLNAHNLLLDAENVTLIDFDRARRCRSGQLPERDRLDNLKRLESSLQKLARQADSSVDEAGWGALVAATTL